MVREQETGVRDAGTAYWGGLGHARCGKVKVNQVCFKQRKLDLSVGSKRHLVLLQNQPVTNVVPGQISAGAAISVPFLARNNLHLEMEKEWYLWPPSLPSPSPQHFLLAISHLQGVN